MGGGGGAGGLLPKSRVGGVRAGIAVTPPPCFVSPPPGGGGRAGGGARPNFQDCSKISILEFPCPYLLLYKSLLQPPTSARASIASDWPSTCITSCASNRRPAFV